MDHSLTLHHGTYHLIFSYSLIGLTVGPIKACAFRVAPSVVQILQMQLKYIRPKVPLRPPKKWWPPIWMKLGKMIIQGPNFHVSKFLWTFDIKNSFIYEFEIWVSSRSVSGDTHSTSHFNNYKNCMYVSLDFEHFYALRTDVMVLQKYGTYLLLLFKHPVCILNKIWSIWP